MNRQHKTTKIVSTAAIIVIALGLLIAKSSESVEQFSGNYNDIIFTNTNKPAKTNPIGNSFSINPNQSVKKIKPVNVSVLTTTKNTTKRHRFYLSQQNEGFIGSYNGSTYDNPSDNIFNVNIDTEIATKSIVWLRYKLRGVDNFCGVSCSVNDRLSFGGYLVKTDTTASLQRIRINPRWLKKGDNRLQFGVNDKTAYGYKIEELSIEIEEVDTPDELIVVNNPIYSYNGQVYIHGYLSEHLQANIHIDNEDVMLNNGEFEKIIDIETDSILIEAKIDGIKVEKIIKINDDRASCFSYAIDYERFNRNKYFNKNEAGTLKSTVASLEVSKGVLQSDIKLSLTNLRQIDLPALGLGMTNVTAQRKGVRLLPHGEHFAGDGASVALKYDRTLIPDGYTEDDIRTFYFNPVTNNWESLERDTVNKDLCMVISKTTHFTDMINGIIQTPESPETQGFAPTMMNDIKAADPTSKINLIAPPTANNMGSANLSYPIEILPVRNTVNPNLAIQYNSDAGSGWLGEGWDLSIPTISVDTRWGVPRYDPLYETETYSFNGTMLATMVKDAGSDINNGVVSVGRKGVMYERLKGQVQFHPVSGGNFDLIIREGTNPSNYQWKVTNKSGVTYTFGTDSAVLKGNVNTFEYYTEGSVEKKRLVAKEAIAEWRLSKIEDQYGNFCNFNYRLATPPVIGNSTLKTKEIVPELITIGKSDTTLQTIKLILSQKKKNKTTNNARYGFLTSSNSLLEYIEIYDINNVLARKYKFEFENGEFAADILKRIAQFDSNNSIVALHNLDYYSNIKINDSISLFSNVDSVLLSPIIEDEDFQNLPALGGNLTTSYGGSLYLGGGVGIDISDFKFALEVGYNGSVSVTNNNTKMLLADITGDGLPDKLYTVKVDGVNHLYYMKNKGNGFGNPIDAQFSGVLSATEISNSSNGWKGNFDAFDLVGINAGMDWMSGKSETTAYLSDVNNDGLVDIVNGKVVYFNCISRYEDDEPIHSFSTNSGYTPSPIINGQTLKRKGTPLKISDIYISNPVPDPDPSTIFVYNPSLPPIQRNADSLLAEKRAFYENIPLQDVVRVWESPYSGNIKIESPVKLIGIQNDSTYDGVRVAIQYKGVEYWSKKIERTDTAYNDTTIYLDVIEGDRIFFRLQAGNEEFSDGSNDVVSWNPLITYTDRINTTDANGYGDAIYPINEGTFVSKIGYNLIDSIETTNVLLKGNFTKPETSDDVYLKVYLTNDSIIYQEVVKDTVIFNDFIDALDTVQVKRVIRNINPDYHPNELISTFFFEKNQSYNHDFSIYINSLRGVNHYRFELSSNSNVCWDRIICKPEIHCRINGVDSIIYAGVKYECFSNVIQKCNYFEEESEVPVTIKPKIAISQNKTINSSFLMILRTLDGFMVKKNIEIVNNVISPASKIELPNLSSARYWVEYYLTDTCLYDISFPDYELIISGQPAEDYKPSIFSKRLNFDFGPMWRGWGQFQYNANNGRYASPIEENKLYLPRDTALAVIKNEWGIKNMRMFSLNPESVKKEYWMGLNDNIFISEDAMCAGRINVHELPSIAEHNNANGASRVNRFTSYDYDVTNGSGETGGSSSVNNIQLQATVSGPLHELKTAPVLSSKQKSTSGWGGASNVFGVLLPNLTKAKSEGTSVITSSFMDMNGDGYPDYITDTQIEYTNRHGGLDREIAGYKKNQTGNIEWISGTGTESNMLTD